MIITVIARRTPVRRGNPEADALSPVLVWIASSLPLLALTANDETRLWT
jgi:hypothetical protein